MADGTDEWTERVWLARALIEEANTEDKWALLRSWSSYEKQPHMGTRVPLQARLVSAGYRNLLSAPAAAKKLQLAYLLVAQCEKLEQAGVTEKRAEELLAKEAPNG